MTGAGTETLDQVGRRPVDQAVPGPLVLRDLVIDPPLLNASGAFDVAAADPDWCADAAAAAPLGGYVTKTVTLEPRLGNPQPWVDQLAPDTLVNSVGLANPGVARVTAEWDRLAALVDRPMIVSVGGAAAEILQVIERLEQRSDWVDGYELNLSCPNVDGSAALAAASADAVERVVAAARSRTARPLLVKLTAACADLASVARAAESAGADALTAVNTMPVRALDDDARPLLGSPDGGMSGALLHPIALRAVATVSAAVSIPVVGVGGVGNRAAARRMFACGAAAVGVGSAAAISASVLADVARLWRTADT